MREAGFQIDRIQRGFLPSDFKPMSNIGKAVAEIRIFDESGAFRQNVLTCQPKTTWVKLGF